MKKFEETESNPERKKYVSAYINAIELARNSKFKEAMKKLENNVQLSNFRTGSIKSFYENIPYIDLALCVNIVEDISDHITIHKAKGAEYENVFVVGNESLLDFLLSPNIDENEEHRVFYVALSRAKKGCFCI